MPKNRCIQIDREVVDAFDLPYGHWEAKDTHANLPAGARRKSEAGYLFKNQYRVKVDKRDGIVDDPNHAEDPECIPSDWTD